MPAFRHVLVSVVAAAMLLAACGDDDDVATGASAAGEEEGGVSARPTVVVTTSVLGDIVENLVRDQAEVVTVMPAGADPHDFQASAQQANQIREADALIVNGADFEEGLLDVIESAEGDGVATFEAISTVDTLEFGEGGHADEEQEGHSDDEDEHADEEEEGHSDDEEEGHPDDEDEHSADDGHGHDGADPHFFLDPVRTAEAVEGIGEFLAETVEGIDVEILEESVASYVDELEALRDEVEELLAAVPDDGRVLVTNHEAFGYFADRYAFEVIGTVIPSGSTADGASAGALAELAELVRDEGVPAIFADTSAEGGLAETLASEVGQDVSVVQLFTESLGQDGSGGESYVDMIRTNAERIADALG